MTGNPQILTLREPLSMDDAREASRALASKRRAVEDELERQVAVAAEKEHAYRKKLSREIVKADGAAPVKKAIADAAAAAEAKDRDIAHGMVRVLQERLKGLEGERAMLRALVEWSMRELERQQPSGPVIGGQRAA